MNREEAKEYIYDCLDRSEATEVIEALEQEPILDKVRAEIIEEKNRIYSHYEKYRDDRIKSDPDSVEDDGELSFNHFLYGISKAIQIIDKYRESEDKQ